MLVRTEHLDIDYTEYLGPNYKTTTPLPAKVSTIVSNHTSHLDFAIILASEFKPAFVAKKPFRKEPIIGLLCEAL